jgi:hypothetical protein
MGLHVCFFFFFLFIIIWSTALTVNFPERFFCESYSITSGHIWPIVFVSKILLYLNTQYLLYCVKRASFIFYFLLAFLCFVCLYDDLFTMEPIGWLGRLSAYN